MSINNPASELWRQGISTGKKKSLKNKRREGQTGEKEKKNLGSGGGKALEKKKVCSAKHAGWYGKALPEWG